MAIADRESGNTDRRTNALDRAGLLTLLYITTLWAAVPVGYGVRHAFLGDMSETFRSMNEDSRIHVAVDLLLGCSVLFPVILAVRLPGSRLVLRRAAKLAAAIVFPGIEDFGDENVSRRDRSTQLQIERTVASLLREHSAIAQVFEPGEREQLVATALERIEKSLGEGAREEVRKRFLSEELMVARDLTVRRLQDAVRRTASRTTNNLLFGIAFSITAVVILFMSLGSNELSTNQELARYFIPRILVVLLVELVAYFFLRLYRSGIEEVRFYQNELTNAESRWGALSTSLLINDASALRIVIKALAETERNFVLSNGATTVELEKHKMQQISGEDIVKLMHALLKSK